MTPLFKWALARTKETRWAPVIARQRACADSTSLSTIASAAAGLPAPRVTLVRSLTVENVDSMGFVVRRWIRCSALWSPLARQSARSGARCPGNHGLPDAPGAVGNVPGRHLLRWRRAQLAHGRRDRVSVPESRSFTTATSGFTPVAYAATLDVPLHIMEFPARFLAAHRRRLRKPKCRMEGQGAHPAMGGIAWCAPSPWPGGGETSGSPRAAQIIHGTDWCPSPGLRTVGTGGAYRRPAQRCPAPPGSPASSRSLPSSSR